MHLRRKLLSALLLLFLVPGVAWAESLPSGVEEVTSVGGITEYRLDNGLQVLLFPDNSTAKTTVNVTYLVGSRHEGYGETGMAHLLEHLLFKGSKNHPNIPQEISEHGASANGTTWLDRTNYYETFPADPENLRWALSMEADRMVNSFISKKDLDSEMTVVRNEFEQGENSPTRILNERVFSAAYLWHNYGNSTIGARADIENVPIERLQAFYRKYYQPDNAVLIVAGRFQTSEALQMIAETFGSIPKPERKLIPTYTQEPAQDGERRVELRRVGDIQAIAAAYHIPSGADPDFPAVDVLGEILADTPSGRLYKALVSTKLATSVGGGAYQLKDPGLMFLQASARKDADLNEIEQVLLSTAQGFAETPPTEEEVERARQSLLKSMETTLRDSRSLSLQLSEWAAMGDWRLFFLHRQRLREVTPEQVAQVAEKYLITSNRTVGRFLPEDEPKRARIAHMSEPQLQEAIASLAEEAGLAEGEEFDPTPDNIKARTTYHQLGKELKVAFLPKNNRGNTVTLSMVFRFGNPEALRNLGSVPDFTGGLLTRGTSKRTREQLKDQLTALEASGSVGGDYDSTTARFTTTKENLPALLELIAEMMQEPSFPEDELETLREGTIAGYEQARNDPASRAALAMGQVLDPYPAEDPRTVKDLEDEIAAAREVTLQEIKDFHRTYYGAQIGQIAVVGDFDEEETLALLTEAFGSWRNPDSPRYQRLVSEVKTVETPVLETISIPDKTNAVYYAAKSFPMTDEDPDYAALRLANYILGGGFLNSRLATRVRQQEGLSYSISSSAWAGSLDAVGGFSVYAIAAPENVEKVQTAIREELEKAIAEGFSSEELEAGRRGYLESLKVARSQDRNLAGLLNTYQYLERDLNWLNEWEERLLAVTTEDLQRVVKLYFHPDSLNIVTSGSLAD